MAVIGVDAINAEHDQGYVYGTPGGQGDCCQKVNLYELRKINKILFTVRFLV